MSHAQTPGSVELFDTFTSHSFTSSSSPGEEVGTTRSIVVVETHAARAKPEPPTGVVPAVEHDRRGAVVQRKVIGGVWERPPTGQQGGGRIEGRVEIVPVLEMVTVKELSPFESGGILDVPS